ncbi:hypothetical protein GZH46_00347 [Fragariocoptes setiger]|uniref:Uncharacterized protein n=1 Tax=Fragariocoptes setiger TaxID=1670756 RepID=A0ABQ7SCE9_9ACAR|nr:hypothetical protein GZH46_00347 [Fragariocoptes setiger]
MRAISASRLSNQHNNMAMSAYASGMYGYYSTYDRNVHMFPYAAMAPPTGPSMMTYGLLRRIASATGQFSSFFAMQLARRHWPVSRHR